MITNIVDRRKRPYRFHKINAIVEAAWHDNRCPDADRIEPGSGPDYEEREHISLTHAINWATQCFKGPVTLFLYDEDGGIYPKRRAPR